VTAKVGVGRAVHAQHAHGQGMAYRRKEPLPIKGGGDRQLQSVQPAGFNRFRGRARKTDRGRTPTYNKRRLAFFGSSSKRAGSN